MACACGKNSKALQEPAGITLTAAGLHSILPGESCAYCASKHIGIAVASLAASPSRPLLLGELELARRHSLLEFPDLAETLVDTMSMVSSRRDDGLAKSLHHAAAVADAIISSQTPSEGHTESYRMSDAPPGNPFVGELHLCAAYRLSFELGYAIPNRPMILGDMALATEALSGIAYAQAMDIREYRHRVQTMRASDVNIYWPRIAGEVSAIIDARLESLLQEHWDPYLAYISSGPPRT